MVKIIKLAKERSWEMWACPPRTPKEFNILNLQYKFLTGHLVSRSVSRLCQKIG
jgi:hypothetical protein